MEQPQGPVYREGIRIRTDPDARNARAALVLDNFLTSTDKYRHNQYRDRNGRPSFLWPQQGRMLLGSDIRLRELAEVDSEGRVVTTRGLVVSPGASGKTALIAGAMEFAGIGRETPYGTLRGMVTTGSRFVPQTAKELARFLPELKITTAHGDQTAPDMSGDLIVVGHGVLPKHYADGTLGRQGIDLWTADEAHRLLGPQIHECAERLVEEHHSWGYTATPDLADPTKSAYNLFRNEFYRTGNREMIKAGHIQGVQLYGLVTRARIRAPRGNEDYTEEDLAPLARDPERNAAIVSVALKMLEEGRKVVINCIEGGGSAHARLIADILNTQKISGRLVKAVAAGDFMGSSKLSRVMQDVVNNEYDVLVQT